jgi:iron complex transport system ATP-binding protein
MVSLATRNLVVRRAGVDVVEQVCFSADGGALIGIVGPNGAGKSTLVQALLGLVASTGDILLDGQPLGRHSRAQIARTIAYLPQGQSLHWPLSVDRLVALGRLPHLAPLSRMTTEDRAAVDRAMALADVTALATRTATELSGGERARVLLARALAVEAPALIVDEPLASLDPAHQMRVMEILRDQATRGVLVIAVLHDLGLAARYCDRLMMIDRGRLVADGPPDAVLTPERLRETYGIRAWFGSAANVPLIVAIARATSRHD